MPRIGGLPQNEDGSKDERIDRCSSLRIGTWNVEYAAGTAKNERRIALIREIECDLWVFTETHDDIDLSKTHKKQNSLPREGRRTGEHYVAIWSKFPILQNLEVVDPRRSAAFLLDSPLGHLIVFGTVFPWHADRGGRTDVRASNWSEHHRAIAAIADEWQALQKKFPEAHLLVAGDLNMDLGGRHYYGTAKGRGLLRDAMSACALTCVTQTPCIPAGLLRFPPIDHILVPSTLASHSKVVRAWEGTAEGVRLSDHSGLAVEIAFGANESASSCETRHVGSEQTLP